MPREHLKRAFQIKGDEIVVSRAEIILEGVYLSYFPPLFAYYIYIFNTINNLCEMKALV